MWTIFSCCWLVVLVSAHFCSTLSDGSIKLCTDSPTSFVNGIAIPAILGEPVSVVFCVQCESSLEISKLIQIRHPNHPTVVKYYFYTNNKDVGRPIIVNITSSANKATINITIKAVRTEDFTDQFSVIIHTNKSGADNSVFFFRLKKTVTPADNSVFVSHLNTTVTSGNSSETQGVAWKIWVTVGVLAAAPTITAVVLVCVFFKKKANLKETSFRRGPEGKEVDHQQDREHQPEAEHQQEADSLQCQEAQDTTDLHDKESGRFITNDGLVYLTVGSVNKQINKRSQGSKHPSKHKCDYEGRVEYITLDFEKTGKLLVADEEDSKDDDSGEKTDT